MLKKLHKILICAVVLLIAVPLVVAVGVQVFGGRALEHAVESVGTRTLKVNVTVDDASLSVLHGRMDLLGLTVANPPGYQHEHLLAMASGRVEMDVASLAGDTVNIHHIDLDNVVLVIEQKDVIQNNLHDVIKSLPPSDAEPSPEDKKARKLHIDKLTISNVKVLVKLLPIPGRLDTVELTLAPIEMTNLGHDNKLTLPILTAKILQAVAAGVAEKGRNILPRNLIDPMTTLLRQHGVQIVDIGRQILEKGAAAGEDVGKAVIDNITGLLPGKKEE